MKSLKLITVLIAILLPFGALAQIESIETTIWDQKVIDSGYVLNDETTFQTTIFAGWFDAIYMQEFGSGEPFEIDLEGSWDLYQNGPWAISAYAGIFILNIADPLSMSDAGEFHTARELGLTTTYNLKNGPQLGFYAGKINGEITNSGTFFKFFICDQQKESKNVLVGDFNYGWKALIGYNNEYFLDDTGISHVQGQAWIKYRATKEITLTGHAGKQLNLMDQFDDPTWCGLSASYNF